MLHEVMTDPISDMLIRIKNAQAVSHQTVDVPFSKIKFTLAKLLEKEGFIDKVEKKGKETKKYIKINLKYQDKQPIIQGIKRISKPGQRVYLGGDKIRPVKQGYGVTVISTSSGLVTDKEARKKGLGGEVICEIW